MKEIITKMKVSLYPKFQKLIKQFRKPSLESSENGSSAESTHLNGLENAELNPALELYYIEGKRLFNQGEFAHRKTKYKSDLGIYL
ncbi:MAG: hypothetical protein KA981_05870 [Bacteroidia bacterium]|jgi:hypothetical protein|nr:hypothetical protein [Bacteroidia bacterium]